jgi:hypothetical protein
VKGNGRSRGESKSPLWLTRGSDIDICIERTGQATQVRAGHGQVWSGVPGRPAFL